MTKRNRFSLLVCVLAVLMLAGLMLPVEGRAEEMSDTGSAGEAVTWTLDPGQ